MRRIATVFVMAAFVVVAAAAPAWAHVSISPSSAPKGSDAVLSITVPNEMGNATTTKVQVKFPSDHPIADALVEPIAGWTSQVARKKVTTPIKTDAGNVTQAVDTVTWTATGAGIPVGGFQQFAVSVGLPDADSLLFPTIQTYSNGQTVSWVQQTPPGGPEPDSPAPELTLTAGPGTATTPTTAEPATGGNAAAASNVKKSDVDTAKTVAVIAVVLAALGLIVGVGGVMMGRRRA